MKLTIKFILTCILYQTAIQLTHNTFVSSANVPLYYGWFFNSEIATGLKSITLQYLKEMYNERTGNFSQFLDNLSEAANISDPLNYYSHPMDPVTNKYDPHVTAKFCGNTDCTEYTRTFSQFLEKEYSTEMIGLFFTSRTYGIRVNLSAEQLLMFDEQPSRLGASNFNSFPRESDALIDYPGIEFIEQEQNFKPSESKAHVTISCAPNVAPVTTGTDLLEIVKLENKTTNCPSYSISTAIIKQYGEDCDIFVLYPTHKMVAKATFKVYNEMSGTAANVSNISNWIWLSGLMNSLLLTLLYKI